MVIPTAIWYHSVKPIVPLCWVLSRGPEEKLDKITLLSTELELSEERIVTYFVRRWAVEVTFEEARTHLVVENQKQ